MQCECVLIFSLWQWAGASGIARTLPKYVIKMQNEVVGFVAHKLIGGCRARKQFAMEFTEHKFYEVSGWKN